MLANNVREIWLGRRYLGKLGRAKAVGIKKMAADETCAFRKRERRG